MKKKSNYVVQLRFINADGDVCAWEGFVIGPLKSSELELITGVTEIIACASNMEPEDVIIVPGTLCYSYLDSK